MSTSHKVASRAGKELSNPESTEEEKSVAGSDLSQASRQKRSTHARVASEAGKELVSSTATSDEKSVAGSDLSQRHPDDH